MFSMEKSEREDERVFDVSLMGNYSSSSLSLFICTKYWRIWSSAFESRRFDIFFYMLTALPFSPCHLVLYVCIDDDKRHNPCVISTNVKGPSKKKTVPTVEKINCCAHVVIWQGIGIDLVDTFWKSLFSSSIFLPLIIANCVASSYFLCV